MIAINRLCNKTKHACLFPKHALFKWRKRSAFWIKCHRQYFSLNTGTSLA